MACYAMPATHQQVGRPAKQQVATMRSQLCPKLGGELGILAVELHLPDGLGTAQSKALQ